MRKKVHPFAHFHSSHVRELDFLSHFFRNQERHRNDNEIQQKKMLVINEDNASENGNET